MEPFTCWELCLAPHYGSVISHDYHYFRRVDVMERTLAETHLLISAKQKRAQPGYTYCCLCWQHSLSSSDGSAAVSWLGFLTLSSVRRTLQWDVTITGPGEGKTNFKSQTSWHLKNKQQVSLGGYNSLLPSCPTKSRYNSRIYGRKLEVMLSHSQVQEGECHAPPFPTACKQEWNLIALDTSPPSCTM